MTPVSVGAEKSIKSAMGEAHKLFIYGTLQDSDIQKKIFGRIIEGIEDSLVGYKRSKIIIEGDSYPVVVPSVIGEVEGKVIELTSEKLELVDKYETNAYKREQVILKSGISAWVYIKA